MRVVIGVFHSDQLPSPYKPSQNPKPPLTGIPNMTPRNRKIFDEMFSIAHLYNSASSYAAKPIRIQLIFMSIIFHHYKQLERLSKEIEDVK